MGGGPNFLFHPPQPKTTWHGPDGTFPSLPNAKLNLWFYGFCDHHFGSKISIPCQDCSTSCSRCHMLYIGETGRSFRTRFDEHRAVIGNNANQLLPDILILATILFQMWKCEPSVPFLVATIAAKVTKCPLFPNLALATPMVFNERVFPMFSCICLCLSKAHLDSTFNSDPLISD